MRIKTTIPARQRAFRAALLDPKAPAPAGLQDGAGRPAQKRFDVYRNNVTVALIQAMQAAFPILHKLLGAQNFDQLVRLFVRAHPPTSPLMMHYGAELPVFLTQFSPLSHIAYLPDVARLELAMRRSYHAADTAPFDATKLAVIAPEVLMNSTLNLAVSIELVPSDWPLFDIWRFNTQVGADKPRAAAQSVLITRAEFDPKPHALSLDQAAWIAAVMTGKPLVAAQEEACTHNPDFDFGRMLTLLIQTNSVANLNTPKEQK
ncbi:MAG: DNA-binding domain-containing protein [Tateyamaria sp.]|uniref:HvfC/BufC family peptide modification chaperone n=1 Tax=Tateyamaria sp. TaxID=1929288 RepID=UPI003276BEFB